ncbi:MAG TPA: outer membrane beta-barrel protein [Gemmatimonadaceae bacterium]|nr:outer membrane beta-barrel protein [Gemmatimonadaceae bacterium]
MTSHTRKLATLGATALALASAATPALAQKTGIGFGASVGANVPNGDFANGAKTGLVVNGFAGLGTGRFGLRGELLWSRSDLDNAFIRKVGNAVLPPNGVGDVTGDVNMIGGTANIVLPLTQSMFRPYVIGGVGVYRRRVSQNIGGTVDEFQSLKDTQTDLGYNGGVGLSIGGIGPSLFIEARYHSVQTTPERTKFVPVVIGFSF